MGAIHSNIISRDEERSAQDVRNAQKLAEKLFAMDTARSPAKKYEPSKPHKVGGSHISPAHRRSILRIFENMHRDIDKRDGRSDDVTANSTCDNSPIFFYPCAAILKEPVKDSQFGNNQQLSPLQPSGIRSIARYNSFNQRLDICMSGSDILLDPQNTNIERSDAISPVMSSARSRRIPVKGRRVGPAILSSKNCYNVDFDDNLDDENPDLDLKYIYDLRTWEMYLRITESRKNRPLKKTVHIPMTQAVPMQHVNGGCVGVNALEQQDSYSMELLPPWWNVPEHEMIFGDLDE
jgi:hypothetical protein